MKTTPRTRRLNESVRAAIAAILIEEIQDPRLELATVTGASVSKDTSVADIYVTAHGDAERYESLLAGLESARGRIRSSLGQRVSTRVVPVLRFHIDESVDEGMRISEALREEAIRRPISEDPEES